MRYQIRSITVVLCLPVVALACGDDTSTLTPTTDRGRLLPGTALSPAERESLAYMREEEKLARDVYLALQDQSPVFANIITSEQRHMDSVLTLLERYALPDPAEGRAAGEFQNPDLQALYDRLVAAGQVSTNAALQAGVEVEELDIRDLQDVLPQIMHPDIRTVYENLASASANHLRAFYAALIALGGSYEPRHLSDAEFDAVIAGDWAPGAASSGSAN